MTDNLASDFLKYHSPGNRYAYFPPTKKWQGSGVDPKKLSELDFTHSKDKGHLYIHLPFCRSLCTFCGCNIKISDHREDHLEYIEALKKEVELKELASFSLESFTLGGGSPNALHPDALAELTKLLKNLSVPEMNWQDSLCEIDPKIFNQNQMDLLTNLGVKRFSLGVQEFNEEICKNVNRHQKLEHLYNAKEILGDAPFGIDLIFGLPKQTQTHIEAWYNSLKELSPHWVSLYPLAPVPWLAPYQDAYGDFSLGSIEEKAHLFETAHTILLECGYELYGFGHYIKKEGVLYTPLKEKTLFRSVSGLYPRPHEFTFSLGVGAISEFSNGLHQNERILEKYKASLLRKNIIPTERFHHFSPREKDFVTNMRAIVAKKAIPRDQFKLLNEYLKKSTDHPSLKWNSDWLEQGSIESIQDPIITSEKGILFLKNILQGLEKATFGVK